MVKVITGEQSQKRKRKAGQSQPYSYASREGMTGGAITAGSERADHRGNSQAAGKPAAKAAGRRGGT